MARVREFVMSHGCTGKQQWYCVLYHSGSQHFMNLQLFLFGVKGLWAWKQQRSPQGILIMNLLYNLDKEHPLKPLSFLTSGFSVKFLMLSCKRIALECNVKTNQTDCVWPAMSTFVMICCLSSYTFSPFKFSPSSHASALAALVGQKQSRDAGSGAFGLCGFRSRFGSVLVCSRQAASSDPWGGNRPTSNMH